MNFRPTIPALPALALGLALSGSILSAAPTERKVPMSDAVREAIQKFNTRDKNAPNEVTAVLDDVDQPPAAVPSEGEPKSDEAPATESADAGTGKPPDAPDVAAEAATATPEPPDLTTAEPTENSPIPEAGLAVRVEKLQSANGTVDPAQVKLTAPFPAKPLAAAPAGWHLDVSDNAPPFTREVELSPGARITLTIRPHILVPDADGANVLALAEPGYDHPLGYRQTATVGAVLATSIRQLDEDSKQLGNAIDNLQQLLISLPRPELRPHPETKPAALRKK